MIIDVPIKRTGAKAEQENANRELVKETFTKAFSLDKKGFSRCGISDDLCIVEQNTSVLNSVLKDAKSLFQAYQKHYDESPEHSKASVMHTNTEVVLVLAHNLGVYLGSTDIV